MPPATRAAPPGDVALADEVRAAGRAAGLDAVGVAPAEPFTRARDDLHARKAAGLHGGMQFTYRNPDRSTDPRRTLPEVAALVVGARRYGTRTPDRPRRGAHGRVARYVREDAYADLERGLTAVAGRLRAAGHRAVVVADQNALVDREAAYRAGLGWYGKSSLLLLPGQGSWFVLGSVLTDAALPADEPVADGCGTCHRCLDGCPTGAIVAPGVVDARRCLAWLVQSPEPIPVELRSALGDRLYGCDDCQEVCPPNRRHGGGAAEAGATWVDVIELLESDDDTLMARFGHWYVPRRDPRYVRRTALVVLGNVGRADEPAVRRVVDRYRSGDDELLAEHAAWAAARLGIDEAG